MILILKYKNLSVFLQNLYIYRHKIKNIIIKILQYINKTYLDFYLFLLIEKERNLKSFGSYVITLFFTIDTCQGKHGLNKNNIYL